MINVVRGTYDYFRDLTVDAVAGWNRFWFQPSDAATLGVIRICAGLVMLYVYLGCQPVANDFLGEQAWLDNQAMHELHDNLPPDASGWERFTGSMYGPSLWYLARSPAVVDLFYWYFLAAIACFTVGLFSRVSNVLIWVGHLSFVHRSYLTWFGMDAIFSMLLLYLIFAPTGDAYSLDRRLARWWSAGNGQAPPPKWNTTTATRMIQIHMCIVYLCSGLAKFQGETWWDGTAIWNSVMITELGGISLTWIASFPDFVIYAFSTFGVAATLFFEVSFIYLIWNRRLRPLMLMLAVMLHMGIALFMGLEAFSASMLTCCMAFIPPESMRWFFRSLRSSSPSEIRKPEPADPVEQPEAVAS